LAVQALVRTTGDASAARLRRALEEPKLRALALRGLALRSARFGERDAKSRGLARELLSSSNPTERAAAAFARAVYEPGALPELLASKDAFVTRAAARLAFTSEAARIAAQRLLGEREASLRSALSIALVDARAADLLPTSMLVELTHEGGPASLASAAALAARLDAELAPLVRELLASADPWLRAHALLGLGSAEAPLALGLLADAYRFEPDSTVRWAAIAALGRRKEPVRERTLRLAAALDAAPAVRQIARRALAGQTASLAPQGTESVWIHITENPGLSENVVPAAVVRLASGVALPLLADPDGLIVVSGVDPAEGAVRLALVQDRVKVSRPLP